MRLETRNLTAGYGHAFRIEGVDLVIEERLITGLIGPNGAGKSTLLKALSRALKPQRGVILLDGEVLHRLPSRYVARKLSLVGQPLDGPLDLTVEELVQRGRFPHQGLFWRDARADREAVEWALDAMRLQAIRHRSIRQLSHGELRRAWTAVALAQRPDILLLDEPTAFLDVAHQFQLLDLISRLRDHGVGIVMALHDLWLTALYCQRVVVMDKGRVVAYGPTEEVLTVDLVRDVFQVEAVMTCHPITGKRIPFPCGVVVRRQGAPASDTETSETEGAGALPEPGDSPSPH